MTQQVNMFLDSLKSKNSKDQYIQKSAHIYAHISLLILFLPANSIYQYLFRVFYLKDNKKLHWLVYGISNRYSK